jgi:hypothetical protein
LLQSQGFFTEVITAPDDHPCADLSDPSITQLFYLDQQACIDNADEIRSGAFIEDITGQVYAQTETPGRVLQAATDNGVEVEDSGRYVFFQDGARIAEQDVIVTDGSVELRLFNDENGNGRRDDGEEYFDDYSQISIAREATAEEFRLNSGWNLVNLPMVDTRSDDPVRTSSDLADYWNGQGADILHIARFQNGQFDIFSKRESGTQYAEDFDIIPGQATFVLNMTTPIDVTFSGNKFEDSVPLQISNGWNLVGIIAPDSDYDSEGVLNALSEQGFSADTISQFENGLYQSVIQDEGNTFGNNFNVIDKRGYFIRVESGGDNQFTP